MPIYELTDTFDFGLTRTLPENEEIVFTSSSGVTALFFSNDTSAEDAARSSAGAAAALAADAGADIRVAPDDVAYTEAEFIEQQQAEGWEEEWEGLPPADVRVASDGWAYTEAEFIENFSTEEWDTAGTSMGIAAPPKPQVVADPRPSGISATATWLQMTEDGQGSRHSSFFIPKKINSRSIFKVEFDFYLYNKGGNPADGFSFNYGDFENAGDLNPTQWHSRYWGAPEHGSAGSVANPNLSFEFDTYGNNAGARIRMSELNDGGQRQQNTLAQETWAPTSGGFQGWGKIIILYGGATQPTTYKIIWDTSTGSSWILNRENETTLTASTIPKIAFEPVDNDFGFLLHARTGGSTQTFSFGNFKLYTASIAPADICFPAGTPVTTDQGPIAIEKLIPGTHTIKEKPIVGISQTKSSDNHLLCFSKHALGHNIPDQQTIVSREHCILYKGKMKRACTFMRYARIRKMKYTGETLYNVVLEKHGLMSVNNMTVETLHPKHWVAKKILSSTFSKS